MRLPLEDKSDDSFLSDSEDDDIDRDPHAQARGSSSSSEDEDEDAVDQPRASLKHAVQWKKKHCQEQKQMPHWKTTLPQCDTVRVHIEYFKEFF